MALPLAVWLHKTGQQCLGEGWKVTPGHSAAPLGKVTGAEGLYGEHSPLSIFLSLPCHTVCIFGETELLGFFQTFCQPAQEQKSCALCVTSPLVTLTG